MGDEFTFLHAMLAGVGVGLFNFFITLGSWKDTKPKVGGSFWHLKGAEAQKKILRSGSLAISPRNWIYSLGLIRVGLIIALLMLGIFTLITESELKGLGGLIGISFGFFFGGLLAYPFGFGRILRGYRLEVAQMGAKMLARLNDTRMVAILFTKAAKRRDKVLRIAAAIGFGELGEMQHLDKLELLCKDGDPQVKESALKAVLHLQKLLIIKPLSVLQLRAIFNDYWTLKYKVEQAEAGSSKEKFEALAAKNQRRFLDILDSQLALKRAFPHIYCQKCYAFAERQTAWDWQWVRCKSCQDAVHLVTGVQRITGQIGGRPAWNLSEGHLKVQLWDATVQSARSGRISTLEIIGGQTIDYDWAVSAVVEKLHNENPDYGKAILVVLVGQPDLSANSVKLLRDLDPTFPSPHTPLI